MWNIADGVCGSDVLLWTRHRFASIVIVPTELAIISSGRSMRKLATMIFTAVIGASFVSEGFIKKTSQTTAAPLVEQDAQDASLLRELSRSFSRVAETATPSVVYIESFPKTGPQVARNNSKGSDNPLERFNEDFFNHFFGLPYFRENKPVPRDAVRGTGFLISSDGYIVTNNHVIDDAGKIYVMLHDGKKYLATLVGTDAKTDLAVIKIQAEHSLPYLSFGNSDSLKIGDWSIAIGNPFGLQATVTVGIISAKGRNQLHIADFEDFIQTDAAINPGNSGGPLLNLRGEVIGVNTAIVSGSGGYIGIGFAIPSMMAKRIADQLIQEGQVTRGFLGVTLQAIDSELAACYKLSKVRGVLVTDVAKDSPASQAGLKQEDVIISYNGKEIDSLSGFRNAISLMQPGSQVVLRVIREGKEIDLSIVVAKVPVDDGSLLLRKLGMQVKNLTPDLANQVGVKHKEGVLITGVEPGSLAASSGIAPGQVILAVNRQRVASVEEIAKILKDGRDKTVLLMISHGEIIRFIALKMEE